MTFSVALHPRSPTITGVAIDWTTARRLAPGSDLWPATWSSAGGGTVYATWGDGGGFGGTGSVGRIQVGLGAIAGTTPAGLTGRNIVGGATPRDFAGIPIAGSGFTAVDANNPGMVDGKIDSLLALSATEVLTCVGAPNGTSRLAVWTPATNSWRWATWPMANLSGPYLNWPWTFGQAGQDYGGRPDPYIYALRGRPTAAANNPTPTMLLARCPVTAADKLVEGAWQHYSGTPAAPAWSASPSASTPVATFLAADDPAQVGISYYQAVWVAPLLRWIVTCSGDASDGVLRFYEATALWDEWRLVGTVQSPANAPGAGAGTAFGVALPAHALAVDGKSGLALVTGTGGYDALTAATFTLTTAVVAGGMPQFRNFPYQYTIGLSTASPPVLTLTQFDASTGLTRTITWTSALLAQLASPPQGAFGWLCAPGRVVEITGEAITPPGATQAGATLVMPGLAVSAQVTSVGGTGWPNGYATRRTFVVPPQDDLAAATLVDFILEFDTDELPAQDWSWLASGFQSVVGGVPFDLRFETVAGAKVDHWVMLYAAAPPRLVWRMRVPNPGLTTGPSGAAFPFRLYSGKAGLSATEENRTGVFAGVLAARVFPSGQDVSGKGRHLTTVSGVTAGTVDGLPGGVFGSASLARLPNPTWLDNVAALTEVVMLAAGANPGSGNLWRAGGTTQGTARASTFLEDTSAFEPGWNAAKGSPPSQAGGNNAVLGPAGSTVAGETHLWQFDRSSGNNCHLYRDEAALAATYVGGGSPTAVGFIFTQPGDLEGYGAGTGTQTTAFIGTYGLAELWPKVLGPAWAAVNARSRLAPRGLVGVGDPDQVTDAVTGPVAVPVRRTIVGDTTLDVAALAYDDQSPRTVALVAGSVVGDANCKASVAPGGVLLQPAAGTVQAPAAVDYMVGKGAKRSTARLFLTVSGGQIIQPGEAWRDVTDPALTGWATIPPLASAPNKVFINSNADLAKMNPGVPGTTYVIGGNLTGSVTVSGNGTKTAPIVIRGADDSFNKANFPKWTSSGNINLRITGSHVYVQKICWVGNASMDSNVYVTGNATRVSIEHCWSYGQSSSHLYNTSPYGVDSGANVRFFRLRYSEHGNPSVKTPAGMWTMQEPNGTNFPLNIYVYRNLVHDIDDRNIVSDFGSVIFSIGRGEHGNVVDNKAAFYDNRLRDIIATGESIEMKCSGVVLAYNTLEQSPDTVALRFRHGHNCQMIGNLYVAGPGGGAVMQLEARGSGHNIINNWAVTLPAGAQVTASSPLANLECRIYGGNIDGSMPLALVKPEMGTPRPNSIAYQIGGNRVPLIIGWPDSAKAAPPLGAVACIVGTVGASRNRSWSVGSYGDRDYAGRGQSRAQYGNRSPSYGTPFGGSSTITNRAIKDADYDLVPVRLFDSDVGVGCTVYP